MSQTLNLNLYMKNHVRNRLMLIGLLLLGCVCSVFAEPEPTKGKGTRKKLSTTHVARSKADAHRINNYSFKGNINPATGRKGTRSLGSYGVKTPRRVKGQP